MGKAIIIKGANFAQVAVDTLEINVSAPSIGISLGGEVTIVSDNDVYYTTDGTTPTKQSTKYTAPFTVALNTTVKAVAFIGNIDSDVVSATYNASVLAPTISISKYGEVTITNNTTEATVYYNVNGASAPTSSDTEYTAPFTVENGDVVKAVAIYTGLAPSPVASATAVVEGPPLWNTIINGEGETSTLEGWFVSPLIPVAPSTPTLWTANKTGGVSKELIFVSKSDGKTKSDYWASNKLNSQGQWKFSTLANAAYCRICAKMGENGRGTAVYQDPNEQFGEETKLWEYDGSVPTTE